MTSRTSLTAAVGLALSMSAGATPSGRAPDQTAFFSTNLAFARGAPAPSSTSRTKKGSEADMRAISKQLAAAVDRGAVPGVVALVVNRDGVVYEGAFGKLDVARNVKMPADAIFRIASMTKPITSVAVMMLLEEGKLRLDDPVSAHLPAFDNLKVIVNFNPADGKYDMRPAKRPVTIRHLLSHTSGIGYTFSSPVLAKIQTDPARDEWEYGLLHDPGDKWTYGASTRVLGLMVEQISGKPLDVFVRERIFQPLGMSETSYVVEPGKVARVATVHSRTDGKLVERPNGATQRSPARGDGGLYSTARDYGTFIRMLLNNGRLGSAKILTEASVKMMGDNQIGSIFVDEQPAANPALTRPFPIGAGHDKFGLGFQIQSKEERDAKYRSPGSLSWAGINNTHFWIDPVKHIGGVMFVQVLPFYDEAAIKTLRDFEEQVYRNLR